MTDRRTMAVQERKERIFSAARAIIAQQGMDGLTTRGLAQAAGLTVPTLYNLVGDKDAILTQLVSRNVEAIWDRLEFDRRATPLDMADAIIDEAYAVVLADKAFFRSILPLMIDLKIVFAANPDRDDAGARAANRCVEMAEFAYAAAIEKGLLRGSLSPSEMGQQMFITYRGPMRDWLENVIGDEEMIRRQRRGFYLVLAADAEEDFRETLIARIAALTLPTNNQKPEQEAA